MRADIGQEVGKVAAMVDWYASHTENLDLIGRLIRGEWRVNPAARKMHELNEAETKQFEASLNKKLKEMGVLGDG